MNFSPGITPAKPEQAPAYWFAFTGQKLLLGQNAERPFVPLIISLSELGLDPVRRQYLGTLNGKPCYSAELQPAAPVPDGMNFIELNRLFSLDEQLFRLAGHAIQIVNWDRTQQYCGRCGTPTHTKVDERAKLCPNCGLISFPRLSPAVIVAVVRDNQLLLARGARFSHLMYSVLAGFVEPGETLEECVQREIREEVGIEVKNIKYFGSQSWPFPDSLMIGFTAEYSSGELRIDEHEIKDAGWFSPPDFPPIPDKISISRRLIDWFVEHNQDKQEGIL